MTEAPRLTLAELRERLEFSRLERREHEATRGGTVFRWVTLSVLPSNPQWPSIDLVFDADVRFIDSVAISETHWHYDSFGDERRNIGAAVRDVARLLRRRDCLMECLDAKGHCFSGEVTRAGGVPSSIDKRVRQIRRIVFDRAPSLEAVDRSRYKKGAYGWRAPTLDPTTIVRPQDSWLASPCLAAATDTWDEYRVSGHADGSVRLWNLEPDEEAIAVFPEHHDGAVRCLAWGLEGFVASGGDDGVVRVWVPETGRLLQRLAGHRARVDRLEWIDGWRLASRADGHVRLWNAETGSALPVESLPRANELFRREPEEVSKGLSRAIEGAWEVQGTCRFELGELDDWRREMEELGLM